jgi:hypothetical protein
MVATFGDPVATGPLAGLVAKRAELDRAITKLVDSQVALGVGWPEIAAALGVTRQAARQAYLRRHPEAVAKAGTDSQEPASRL